MPPGYAEVLRETINRGNRPKLYLDTNVILDILRPQRRPESLELLNAAREKGWTFATSIFASFEALDVEQENRWFLQRVSQGESIDRLLRSRRERDLSPQDLRDIGSQWEDFRSNYGFILEWAGLREDGWEEALNLSVTTNMSAADCIHVATALITQCDVLVTSDEALRKMAESHIATALPRQLLEFIPPP